jgi:hypothetical protein
MGSPMASLSTQYNKCTSLEKKYDRHRPYHSEKTTYIYLGLGQHFSKFSGTPNRNNTAFALSRALTARRAVTSPR